MNARWESFVARWLARADGDRRLRAVGTASDVAFTLRSGGDCLWVHLRDGAVAGHALDAGFDRRVDFGLVAPPEVWARLWSPVPPPRAQTLFALLSKEPALSVEGSRESLAQSAHLVCRLLELGREDAPSEATADGPPDLSALRGRYVRVALETGEAEVYAEQAGDGRDLLMLHTAGSDSRQYHHLLADAGLREAWRMTAFDLPGHGRSTLPSGLGEGEWRLTTDRYVEAIVATADALELEHPVVMGCSMGGEICLELAYRHPDRFAAVVACQAADRVEGRQVGWAKHPRVNEKLFVPEWVDGLMSPTAPAARRAEVRWAYAQSAHGVYWGDIDFYSREWDARDRVGEIDTERCPVHILCGEYDYSCTPELAEATARRIPGARFTLMRGLGHFPMAEDPERFLGYLEPVLAELAGDPVPRGTAAG